MAFEIRVPRLGWSMEEGTFLGWLKRDGDPVSPGDPLYELEGEKATQEIEAVDGGILRIPPEAPKPGTIVAVGALLAYLTAGDEAVPSGAGAILQQAGEGPGRLEDRPLLKQATVAVTTGNGSPKGSTAVATPRARRVAKELGIEWTTLQGSGRNGRIREQDVRLAKSPSGTVSATASSLPVTSRRRVIAEKLAAGVRQAVPVTLTTRADATRLVATRTRMKAAAGVVPTLTDLIAKEIAPLLLGHRLVAGRWEQDRIVLPTEHEIHVGIAVDTDDGLLVPVLRDVVHTPLATLAQRSKDLVTKARSGELTAADMQGGVFTITNLGAYGIDAFTPVINVPESAILGVGAIRREAVVTNDGGLAVREQLTLSLTFDHRVIDGAPAARFLQAVVQALEQMPHCG